MNFDKSITLLKLTSAIVATILCPNYSLLLAQDVALNAEISLDEFITTVSNNDTVFEQILIDNLPLAYQKQLRLPARDIVLGVKQDYLLGIEHGGDGINTAVSLSKLFPMQGTEVGLDYSTEEFRGRNSRTSEINFSIAQPIAENAFGRGTKLLDQIIGLETQVARHQIIEAYEDYFATVITAYIIWHEAWENLKIAESSYRENQKLLKDIKARQQKQIALPIDVNKIQLQVLAKEEALIEYRERYQTAYNTVQRSMRTAVPKPLRPVAPSRYDLAIEQLDKEIQQFRKDGRTFAILGLLEQKTAFQIDKDADDLLPSIELSAGYRILGDEYSLENKENIIFAGITVEFPFRDQVQEARHAVSRIAAKKQKLITTNTDFDLQATLKNLYAQIERERKLLAISRQKLKLAQSVLRDEAENYSFGKVALNDYIQAVNVLDSNRFNQVARQARLRRLVVEWLRLVDRLISKKDVKLSKTH